MMLPQTDLRYSYEYAKRLYHGKDFADSWQKIVERGGGFETLYGELIDPLLELIQKYSGYEWDEYADSFIPIYVADVPKSFSHPLTLRADEDPVDMVASLLHELVHCNMFFGFPSDAERESAFFAVSKAVASELDATLVAAVNDLENEERATLPTYRERTWNLKEKPASEYLEKG